MEISDRSTVVGIFEDAEEAEAAIKDLRDAGFGKDHVGLAVPHGHHGTHAGTSQAMDLGAETGPQAYHEFTGALKGLGIGGVLGAVAALLIPGLGAATVAGVLAGALAGAGAGAAAGGIAGALQHLDIEEEDARYYEREVHAGRSLVAVRADGRAREAAEILMRHGAYGLAGQREVRFSE
jgi:hypothetical protein